MICRKCNIDVTPDEKSGRCPECWTLSPIRPIGHVDVDRARINLPRSEWVALSGSGRDAIAEIFTSLRFMRARKIGEIVVSINDLMEDMESRLNEYFRSLVPKMPSQRYLATFGINQIAKSAPGSIVGQYGLLMRKFDLLYYYDPRPHRGWFEQDTVVVFHKKIVVQVVVTGVIIALLVLNEVFGFINY